MHIAKPYDLRGKRVLVNVLRTRGCTSISVPRGREFDLTKPPELDALFERDRPQVVVNLAAVVGGIGANRDNPGRFFYENAIMGIQLIEAAHRFGVEKTVVAAIYLLPVNLYGPRDNFDVATSHVIPALIRKAIEARESGANEMVVWGDGSATREFLSVDDAAEAFVAATERYNDGAPVNLGSGEERSIRELVEMIAAACGFTGHVAWDTSKPNGQPRRKQDITRAHKLFGFQATTTMRAGVL